MMNVTAADIDRLLSGQVPTIPEWERNRSMTTKPKVDRKSRDDSKSYSAANIAHVMKVKNLDRETVLSAFVAENGEEKRRNMQALLDKGGGAVSDTSRWFSTKYGISPHDLIFSEDFQSKWPVQVSPSQSQTSTDPDVQIAIDAIHRLASKGKAKVARRILETLDD